MYSGKMPAGALASDAVRRESGCRGSFPALPSLVVRAVARARPARERRRTAPTLAAPQQRPVAGFHRQFADVRDQAHAHGRDVRGGVAGGHVDLREQEAARADEVPRSLRRCGSRSRACPSRSSGSSRRRSGAAPARSVRAVEEVRRGAAGDERGGHLRRRRRRLRRSAPAGRRGRRRSRARPRSSRAASSPCEPCELGFADVARVVEHDHPHRSRPSPGDSSA